MKISDVSIKTFRTHSDRWDVGHAQPLPNTELRQTVLTIHTDYGVDGHYLGGGTHGDAEGLSVVDQGVVLGGSATSCSVAIPSIGRWFGSGFG